MRIQRESIKPDANSSFRHLRNPRLNDLYLWHYHPEYELVYITNADGPRHVGRHASTYRGSDLVLIGSDIPHLNFDYGVKTVCEKVVLQIQQAFSNKVFSDIPELNHIYQLLERSQCAIAFYGATKDSIGKRLLNFHNIEPFDQFVELLLIFQLLARSDEYELLHDKPYINTSGQKDRSRMNQIYNFVDEQYSQEISLDTIAAICGLTKPAFCRYFKKETGNTFITFLNQYRISQAKRMMLSGASISEACYRSGFDNLSYFNRVFNKVSGEGPRCFMRGTL